MLAAVLPGCATELAEPEGQTTSELVVRNPVRTGCADPGVMEDDGTYYMTCTGGDGAGNLFAIYTSKDLLSWTKSGAIFAKGAFPGWAKGNWWAPELHRVGTGYVAVFSALSKETGQNAGGIAYADSPLGPYVDRGTPIASYRDNSVIDAHLDSSSGRPIYYFKVERVVEGKGADILRAVALTDDARATVGASKQILGLSQLWEGTIVEAPWVVKKNGWYWLFYSGNFYCNDKYAVGVARSRDPMGPFEKKDGPILASGKRWVGPGHNAVAEGPDGNTYLVYHAYNQAADGVPRCGAPAPDDNNKRHALIDRIVWEKDWPRIQSSL